MEYDLEKDLENAERISREQKEDAAVEQEAMDYAWGEACSQPEPITSYEARRGE